MVLLFASPASAQVDMSELLSAPILPKSEMIINPMPPVALVTQMPVWLAVKDWDTVETSEGPAVPVSVTYDMGDGNRVVCNDKGVVWNKSLGNDQSTNCSYTYTRSSAGAPNGVFDIKGHVTYKLPTRNVDGPISTLHVVVSEIQAINISPNQQGSGNVKWDQDNSPENHDNGGRSGLLGAIADFVKSSVDAIGNALGMTAGAIGNFIKGFAIGVWDLGTGLYQLAELAYRLGPIRMMTDPVGWYNDLQGFLGVASYIIGHPVDSLLAIGKDAIRWDTFADGKYAQGLGELLPNLLLIVATKGAGALGEAGTAGRTAAEIAAAERSAKWSEELVKLNVAGKMPAQIAADSAKAADGVESLVPVVPKTEAAEKAAHDALYSAQEAAQQAGVDAHFLDRHGADTSLQELYVRANYGLTPDGIVRSPVDSTRFLSHELEQEAYDKAMQAWKNAGSPSGRWTPADSISIGKTVGDGFLANSETYFVTSKITVVIQNGKVFTMYPVT
jgi:hypothetical protein